MKSPDFDYACPTTVSDAIALLDEPGIDAMPLAGGQSLVPMMNFRLARPDRLVDLGRIPGLVGVREDGDVLRIGAMTSYAALLSDPLVQAHLPVLSAVLPHVAHPAIRSRGTVGGSLALADPAAEMPAVLLALNGTIVATGPEGTREIAADDYLLGLYETALTPGDLITEVILPKQGPDARYAFYELARRHGDYAMAGAVVVAGPGAPRVALFGVSDRAVRAPAVEAALAGATDPTTIEIVLDDIDIAADLNGATDTKRQWARVVLRRALEAL